MDKFFYRWIVQSIIKAILTVVIAVLAVLLLDVIYSIIMPPMSPEFDYWRFIVMFVVATLIICFFLIWIKDDYSSLDITAPSVGKFWCFLIRKGIKIHWFWLRLLILSLLAIAVYNGYKFYIETPAVLQSFSEYFAQQSGKFDLIDLIEKHLLHFLRPVFVVFFCWQWLHVRRFCKEGRCSKCGAAFALGYSYAGKTTEHNSSKITKKAKSVVVGERRQETYIDDVKVSDSKISDIYGTSYDYYKTDTHTTTYSSVYGCAFCNASETKYDSHSTINKTKL